MPFTSSSSRCYSLHPQKGGGHSPSSPPGASSASTMPIAELVTGDACKASVDRCVYFNPPTTARQKAETNKFGGSDEEQRQKGLRRFFFGDSPPLRRLPLPPQPFPLQSPQFVEEPSGINAPSPSLSAIRAGRAMLSRKKTFGGISHSSRTISVDFDSETSATTEEAERIPNFVHHKCNEKAAADHLQQQQQPMAAMNNSGGHRTEQKHQTHQRQQQHSIGSPIVVARQQQHANYYHQQQQSQFNGAQFDTQSLQSRSRSRSIGNNNNNTLPLNLSHHRQHSSGGFRHGSFTNLSSLNGGTGGGAGEMILYNGGGIGGIDEECSTTAVPHRHSMALIDTQMSSPPFWYHHQSPVVHPHPPPFYYTAATLPHPPPPMDFATFRRALKESERMDKERKVLVGEQGVRAACWEFCCGGSALVLWLVITLIALGFLGFLLLAIYFL